MTNELPEILDRSSPLHDDATVLDALHAFEVASIGLWTKSFADNSNATNSTLRQLLQLEDSLEFDMRLVVSQCVYADDRGLLEDALDDVVNPYGEGKFDISFRIVTQNHAVRWVSMTARASFTGDEGSRVPEKITGVFRDITEQKETDAHNKLLIDELNHRVKSTLTLVQSVAYQTFRYDVGMTGLSTDFQGRLRALGKAHDLLVERRFLGTLLEPLAERILGSCGAPFSRVDMSGFPLHLGSKQAVSFSMVLHELSVNALKYGAFSLPSGRVDLSWAHNAQSDMVRIRWIETDGPPVIEPFEKGFGSRMIERAIALEFGGGVVMDYAPDGVRCTMTIPYKSFEQRPDE